MKFELSPDDTRRWGARSAKAFVSTTAEVDQLLDRCHSDEVRLVIVRCPTDVTAVAQSLERAGMLLMDTLVYFSRSMESWTVRAAAHGVTTRVLRADESRTVERIAREAFRGYRSHYQADERLDHANCDAVYVDWSLRLCQPAEYPATMLLALVDDEPAGFMAVRLVPGEPGEAVLAGVLEKARRRGVYRTLLVDGVTWLRDAGAASVMLSSQVHNTATQRAWTRLGFEPDHSVYTFHGWF
jgi:ribosomal protein S18 acetylase RimI-like enzyme